MKPRKKSGAPTGFKPMTSAIPVRCSTNWAMKPRCSRSGASSIYTHYMKRMTWCVYDKDHMSALRLKNARLYWHCHMMMEKPIKFIVLNQIHSVINMRITDTSVFFFVFTPHTLPLIHNFFDHFRVKSVSLVKIWRRTFQMKLTCSFLLVSSFVVVLYILWIGANSQTHRLTPH